MRYRTAQIKDIVQREAEASGVLREPGDLALVRRGVPRLLVMKCPDGCGDTLRINLDPRTGKAWKLYQDRDGISLYPSVWRETGCESHFVIWGNQIHWNDGRDLTYSRSYDQPMREAILEELSASHFELARHVADRLGIVPWTVSHILNALEREGKVVSRKSGRKITYKVAPTSS